MNERSTGTVTWFDPEKSYGFITTHAGASLFVHRRALGDGRRWLVEGEEVSFVVVRGMKGDEANDVLVTNALPPTPRIRAYEQREAGAYGGERSFERRDRFAGQGRPSNNGPRREWSNGPRERSRSFSGSAPAGIINARVDYIDPQGRFMFVALSDNQGDAYVHSSLFNYAGNRVQVGDNVRVSVSASDRGLRANSLEI
ncbi:cold-shock protein [Herpetosiphon sp. NSE202]|uniref:cold-shock protein n=1 Tax=Herpetosiphon sp. NSE202 TaxID=3351349 RepID=UPI0036376489